MLKNILEKLFGTTRAPTLPFPTNKTKECGKCGLQLAVSEFNRHSKRQDGLQCWCKNCMSQTKPSRRRRCGTRMRRLREGQKYIKLSFVVTPEQRIILDEICRSRKITISKLTSAVVHLLVEEHKAKTR